jgi:hypothetical protein
MSPALFALVIFIYLFIYLFWWDWGLNSVLCADLSFPISLDYRCEPLAVGCSGYF